MKLVFNHYIIIIVTIISSLFVTSCEKEIDLDLRTADPVLVIEGRIEENGRPEVKITTTKGFFTDNTFNPVEGAEVTVSDDAGNEEKLYLNESSGWYVGGSTPIIKGTVGQTYNLTILHEGQEYTATTKMPPLVKMDSITFFKAPIMDYAFPRVHFKDPVGSENSYYHQKVYINGNRKKGGYTTSDEFRDDTYIIRLLPVFSENGDDDDPYEKGDLIKVEFECIDKGTYQFFNTLYDIDDSLNNPTSAIKGGGAMGYFSAYTKDVKEVVADW